MSGDFLHQYVTHEAHPDIVTDSICQFLTHQVYVDCNSFDLADGKCAVAECARDCSTRNFCYYGVLASKSCPSYASQSAAAEVPDALVAMCCESYSSQPIPCGNYTNDHPSSANSSTLREFAMVTGESVISSGLGVTSE